MPPPIVIGRRASTAKRHPLSAFIADSRTRLELLHTALSQFFIAVAYLVGLRVITELLPTSVYGQVSLALAGLALLSGVFVGPLLAAQLRFHPTAKDTRHTASLYRLLGRFLVVGSLLASVTGAVAVAIFGQELALPYATVLISLFILVWVILDAVISGAGNAMNAERKQGRLSLFRILDNTVRLVSSIVAVVVFGAGLEQFIGGRALGMLALTAVVLFGTWLAANAGRRRGDAGPTETPAFSARGLLAFVVPLIPIAGITWVIHLADRYILALFHGSAEVGIYSATYGLASHPFLMLGGVATLVFRPQVYLAADGLSPDSIHTERRWVAFVLVAGGALLIAMLVGRVPLVDLLLAAPYRGASRLLYILAPAYLLFTVSQVFESRLLAGHRSRAVLAIGVISASVSLGTALLLIPPLAATGAAWATLCGMTTHCAASWLLARPIGSRT